MAEAHPPLGFEIEDCQASAPTYARSDSSEFDAALLDALDDSSEDEEESRVRLSTSRIHTFGLMSTT